MNFIGKKLNNINETRGNSYCACSISDIVLFICFLLVDSLIK